MRRSQVFTWILFTVVFLGTEWTTSMAIAQQPEEQQKMMMEFQKANRLRQMQQMQMNQLMQLLQNKDLREELEVVPDQLEELRQIAKEFQRLQMKFTNETQESQKEVRQLFQEQKFKEAIKLATEMHSDLDFESAKLTEKVEESLLPQQYSRLKQISKQQSLKFFTPFKDQFGIPLALAEELELTPEERKKLMDTIKEARKEYYEKIEEAKKKANQQILESIPVAKRDKIGEILGDYYDHEKQQRLNSDKAYKEHQQRMLEQQRQQQRGY